MAYETEDPIVVNPPQQIETNEEVETSTRNAGQSQATAIVTNESRPQRTYTFTREDIKKFAKDALEEAVEHGAFDNVVQANPILAGTESELTGLEVNGTKYKVISSTDVTSAINTAIYGAIDANY